MAINQTVVLQPRPNVKKINYSAKTFSDFRQNLIEFAKSYYPNTYADFNEASPGMMFIEMAAYMGDVLSFYIDNQFKENLLSYAEQPDNIITLAQFLGYKPKLAAASTATIQLLQSCPAVLTGGKYVPDPKYLLKLAKNTTFTTNNQSQAVFRLIEDVDFTNITEENYRVNSYSGGNPSTFIVTKEGKVDSTVEKSTTFSFGTAQKFSSVLLPPEPVIGIVDVTDSDGNTWYQVDYLAQDVILDNVDVTDNGETGILPAARLRFRKVPRRFTTKITRDFRLQMLFGSGVGDDTELNLTLDSRQIANQQYGDTIRNTLGNASINNVNFLDSNAYGTAPANTTLTVKYLTGGGAASNTPSNTIVNVATLLTNNDTTAYTSAEISQFNQSIQSLAVTNPEPATGGGPAEPLSEIKENALAFFNAQNRVVTVDDYIVRSQALPERYGKVAKVFAVRDEQINNVMKLNQQGYYVDNPVRPNAINLYTLGYDINGNLTTLNTITKQNLARYLEQFRMLTDDINILDAFIINIGVEFSISVAKNYNMNDVLGRCIGEVQSFFDISKWSINQPIVLADLSYNIGMVDGVKNVKSLGITNKYLYKDGTGYQNYRYEIDNATVNDVIYPSLDPSIFELKFPQNDIIGHASQ